MLSLRRAIVCRELGTTMDTHLLHYLSRARLQARVRRHVRPLPQLEQIEPFVSYSDSLRRRCLIHGQPQSLGDVYCGEMRVFRAAAHSCIA